MQAHKLTMTAFSLGAALALGTPAKAADLPQSGTIKARCTIKGGVNVAQVECRSGYGRICRNGNLTCAMNECGWIGYSCTGCGFTGWWLAD